MRNPPTLSLVTAYRRRPAYLNLLLCRLAYIREHEGFTDFELILVEGDAQPSVDNLDDKLEWVQYLYVPVSDVFNRSLLINRGAAIARGQYFFPCDVDLLPADGVLSNHLALAVASPISLVAGYRLQLPEMLLDPVIPDVNRLLEGSRAQNKSLVCPEDSYGALTKYLLCGEKVGACVCYPRNTFIAVGGLDEQFAGWGPEDQDLIERACDTGFALVRCYDLLYYHLPHDYEKPWYDPRLIEANRARYEEKRRAAKRRETQ